MDDKAILKHGRIFSENILKEVSGQKGKKVENKEIADTHTIEPETMVLLLGRVEELYKVANKLRTVGLTAAAAEIEESIADIEKMILSNPVVKEEQSAFNKYILKEMQLEQQARSMQPVTYPDISTLPIGTPLVQDDGTAGSRSGRWLYSTTSAASDMNTVTRGHPSYNTSIDNVQYNSDDYAETMRRAYDRLTDQYD